MLCSCCARPKENLKIRNSKLMPGAKLFLCESCKDMEPRYLVVLYGRQNGIDSVKKYISRGLYAGRPIEASELV